MAGRPTAKEEQRHTAARSLPFSQPQLFPTVPIPPTTASPSLAGFLLPELPPLHGAAQPQTPSPAHHWKAFWGHGEPTAEG